MGTRSFRAIRTPWPGDGMERIRNKIFSVEEANGLIPYLEQAVGSLAATAREIASLQGEIRVLSAIESSGATSRNLDVRVLRENEARCARMLEEFRAALHEIAARGCILRDLDLGLVDFYTMARDRVKRSSPNSKIRSARPMPPGT